MNSLQRALTIVGLAASFATSAPAFATVLQFGDKDLLGTGSYGGEPTAGATLEGLSADVVTKAVGIYPHSYPFQPAAGDFAGTDQIYVGSTQTSSHDGYSNSARLNGPQIVTLDYQALHPAGTNIATFTLGIAADDFQNKVFGQPFTAKINGVTHQALTTALNDLDQSGPVAQFLSIGLNPSLLAANDVLTLSIDQGGDGGDGWAVDFFTVGVTTSPVPVPAAAWLFASALAGGFGALRRLRPIGTCCARSTTASRKCFSP